MAEKKKQKRQVSPIGPAVSCFIDKPSYTFAKEGVFSMKLRFDPNDPKVAPFLASLKEQGQAAWDEAVKGSPKTKAYTIYNGITDELNETTGDPTGMILVSFKAKHRIERKDPKPGEDKVWVNTISKFDAYKQPIPANIMVYSGSICRASFNVFPFSNDAAKQHGITLSLCGVQVLKLATSNAGTAESMGFDEQEGYSTEQAGTESDNPATISEDDAAPTTPTGGDGTANF